MKQNNRSKFLRLKSRLYVDLLVFLGMISFPMFLGCGGDGAKEKNQQQINDSLATANHDLTVQKVKADSTALAEEKKAKLDSLARADSIKKTREMQSMNRPEYGIPVNYIPDNGAKKYGVRPVDNNN